MDQALERRCLEREFGLPRGHLEGEPGTVRELRDRLQHGVNGIQSVFTINSFPYVPGSPTSHEAADAIKLSAPNQRERVLAYIRAHGPVSDEQIANGLSLNPSTERPRRIELARAGRIVEAGHAKTSSGRRAVVWVAA